MPSGHAMYYFGLLSALIGGVGRDPLFWTDQSTRLPSAPCFTLLRSWTFSRGILAADSSDQHLRFLSWIEWFVDVGRYCTRPSASGR